MFFTITIKAHIDTIIDTEYADIIVTVVCSTRQWHLNNLYSRYTVLSKHNLKMHNNPLS